MSHVATVPVLRCLAGPECQGNEHGCREPICLLEREILEESPPMTTLTHAEFLRDYGRCPTGPHGCRVAKQLTLEDAP